MPPACAGDQAKSKWGYLTGDVRWKQLDQARRPLLFGCMATVEEIEAAVRGLTGPERLRLVDRLSDVLSDAWDLQIERDVAEGRLDHLIQEVEQDIANGRVVPLDEVIDQS